MDVDGPLSRLGTRGFAVVRGLLGQEELERLRVAFSTARRADVAIYAAFEPGPEETRWVADRIEKLLPELRDATTLRTDRVARRGVFFATEHTNLDWHTDYKSDYLFQGHRDHVTIWMPIVKPSRDRSGLSLIPIDRLRERDERVHRILENRGAARYEGGVLRYEDRGADLSVPCSFPLEEIAESPALAEGDALLVRSDVLHRTQDTETSRVSLALRALHGGHELTASRLLSGSPGKHARMRAEPGAFCEVLGAFFMNRRTQITVSELLSAQERFARKEPLARLAFAGARALLLPLMLTYRLGQGLAP